MGIRLFTPRVSELAVSGSRHQERRSTRAGPLPEAAALLLFAAAFYLSLALASLEIDHNNPDVTGADWVGPVGAGLARTLAQGFGIVSWAFPLELVFFGAPLFHHRRISVSGLRISGDLLIVIVTAALVHVAAPGALIFGTLWLGGNVGLLFGELLSALFSTIGSFLIGGTSIGLILIGRSEFSFIEVCERTAQGVRFAIEGLLRLVARLRRAWGEARRLRAGGSQSGTEIPPAEIFDSRGEDAIIARLAEEDHWIPLERTGNPPLALADSLRAGLKQAAAEQSAPVDTSLLRPPTEAEAVSLSPEPMLSEPSSVPPPSVPAPSPKESEPPESSVVDVPESNDATARALRIVDTRKNATVERGRRAKASGRAGRFELPTTDLLSEATAQTVPIDEHRVRELAQRLESTLADYGVTGKVEEVHPGPTVTTYEVSPQAGTKVSKVAGLSDDLALGLSRKVRIIAPIPGKARIGFEIPNDSRVPVNLRELIEDERFEQLASEAPLPVVLGRNIVGAPFFADLASMPHVIVAGATGAGKSVGLNVMLSSLLFKRSPSELRMLMIDPKVVELAPFDGIPHMLLPVVTDMKQAAKALKWAVDEMEQRYQAFALAGTKNITTYNEWVDRVHAGEIEPPSPDEVKAMSADGVVVTIPAAKDGSDGVALPGRMPHIVIVVDEFADLMMQQGKEVEVSVARLAQKARAAGMHVVLATQRPSVDVITGMIKANFPTRIAFRVAQKVDSRTILDEMGAQLLLGKGDMLVKLNGSTETHRVQCPFVSEEEVNQLTAYLRTQGTPEYRDAILEADEEEEKAPAEKLDARYDEAVAIVAQTQRCSTSWLQRKLTVGYNRAAKIVEAMEANGVVGPANGSKDREIFVHEQ